MIASRLIFSPSAVPERKPAREYNILNDLNKGCKIPCFIVKLQSVQKKKNFLYSNGDE
jgi:hypothetical protein